jgi:hypothetical protein
MADYLAEGELISESIRLRGKQVQCFARFEENECKLRI